MRRKRWETGTTAVLGVRTWFYPYRRDGELLFGDEPSLKSAGALVRVIGETLLPTRRGASLRRVLVEAGIGGSGPYAWVDADDLEPAL